LEVDNTATKRFGKAETNEKGGQNPLKRDLMFFWGLHSTGKFDERTISYALDYAENELGRELQALVIAGVVDKGIEDGVAKYSLTQNESRRSCIIEAARPGHSPR
jgi:hypothetical protein